MNTTILKDVHVGNNVIIGASSLVNKDIPDNVVAAGNPCRVIMSLDDYYKKRQKAQETEAMELVQLYRNRYNRQPDSRALHEFFWLFSNASSELDDVYKSMMKIAGNEQMSFEQLNRNIPKYKDEKDFLNKIR